MRKFTLILAVLALLSTGIAKAVKVYSVDENFTTAPSPATWGYTAVSGHTFGYDAVNKRLTLRWGSPTSYTQKPLATTVTPGSDNKITVETIVKYYTSGNSSSSGNLYFLDASGNAITGIWFGRASSQWRIARSTSYPGAIAPTAVATTANALAADQPLAKITLVLDFTAKTLDYSAQVGTFDATTRVFTASGASVSVTGQAFINAAAADLKTLHSSFYRVSTTTGTNGYDMMYMGISTEQTVSTTNVTVKYKDQDGAYFKTDEIVADQVVGSTYNATLAQKATVNSGGFNYVFDPASPTGISVVEGGSTLELLFRKSVLFNSLTWNGTGDTNGNIWSEWYQNFINGVTSVGYQADANVTLDATAVNKAIVINDPISMGSGNINVSSGGYSLTGDGAYSGTGALNVNLTGLDELTLGVTNSLTGITQISGGNISLAKTGVLGTGVNITGETTLTGTAGVTIPNATISASTIFNSGSFQSVINNISATSGTKVTINNSFNALSTDMGYQSIGIGVTGTLASGSEIEMNGTGTTSRYGLMGVSSDYLKNAKVTLKGNTFLFINTGQGAATTINVGTLAGEAGARIGWGRSSDLTRTITWNVGWLNENSEYAGSISNTGGYQGSGASYVGIATNFIKTGTGTLTFSGAAKTHNGTVEVNGGGKLKVTGSLGKSTSAFTISGSSILAAADTGKIVTSTLVMGGTDTLMVSPGALINVSTGAGSVLTNVVIELNADTTGILTLPAEITTADTLVVRAVATPGASPKTYKLINSPVGVNFNAVILPSSKYTYNQTTGELTYDVTTEVNQTRGFEVYPSIVRNDVTVRGSEMSEISIIGMTGQTLKLISNVHENNNINLSNLSNGVYFVKVRFADGSVKVQNILLQK